MEQDVNQAAQGVLQQRMDEEIEDFLEFMEGGAKLIRGVKRGGQRTEVWMSDRKGEQWRKKRKL